MRRDNSFDLYLGSETVVARGTRNLFHLRIFHRVRVRTPGKLAAGGLPAPPSLLTQPLLAPLHQRVVRVALVLKCKRDLVLRHLLAESCRVGLELHNKSKLFSPVISSDSAVVRALWNI